MEEENISNQQSKEVFPKQSILNYKDKGSQTVLRLFGIELTAPSGLKSPGIVYISFILVNILIFFVLRGFISS